MDRNNKVRAGLIFGIAMSILFILQYLLTNNNQTTGQITRSIAAGLIGGSISGLLFALLTGLFAKSKFVSQATKIDTDPDENILFETPANHFKGMEGVGGKLYLTNKRLIFRSHKFNIQNHQLSIYLSDIKHVERYKPMGMMNNGLSINTSNNTKEKFVVEQAEKWVQYLRGEKGLTI